MPRQTPLSSRTAERKSQHSNFRDLAFGLEAAHLLVERIEELLPGRRAGERRAVEERAAEAAEVEQAFGRAVEGHAHAVEHEDDAGRGVAHALDGRLVGEEVAAVDGLFEVHAASRPRPCVHDGVDAALRAHRVRALDRHEREEVDRDAGLAELDDGISPASPPPTTMMRGVAAIRYSFEITKWRSR